MFTERSQINRNLYWPIALSRIFKAIKRVFLLLDAVMPQRSWFSDGAGVRIAAHFAWRCDLSAGPKMLFFPEAALSLLGVWSGLLQWHLLCPSAGLPVSADK